MEIESNKKEYKIQFLQKLGEGTYGIVYKVKNLHNNEILALKQIKLDNNEDEGLPPTALREITILKQLNHPNIVKLQHVIYEPKNKKLQLFFEYLPYDLRNFFAEKQFQIPKEIIKKLMKQLLQGLIHCYNRRIFHRDIKPQNILIEPFKQILKIADFGLARCFTIPIKTLTHEIETLWYRAPELLLGVRQYSLGVDMWAVGCIFYEFFERKPLFMGNSEIDQIFKIFQFWGTPSQNEWKEINKLKDYKMTFPKFKQNFNKLRFSTMDKLSCDLLLKMLTLDPRNRISAIEALNHEYFN